MKEGNSIFQENVVDLKSVATLLTTYGENLFMVWTLEKVKIWNKIFTGRTFEADFSKSRDSRPHGPFCKKKRDRAISRQSKRRKIKWQKSVKLEKFVLLKTFASKCEISSLSQFLFTFSRPSLIGKFPFKI